MTLEVNGRDLLPAVGTMTLGKSRSEAAATLRVSIWLAPADNYFPQFALALGDAVRLRGDDGKTVFLGAVQQVERTPEQVAFTALDQGLFLARNEVYGLFTGTGADIARQVAARLGLTVGTVEGGTNWQSLATTSGQTAFSVLRRALGTGVDMAVEDGELTAAVRRGDPVALGGERFLDVESRGSLQETVDRCVVLRRGGTVLATAENAGHIAAYGLRQSVETLTGSDAAAQAQAGLVGRGFSADVTVLGDMALRCGGAVEVHQPQWGLEGVYAIAAVTHRWRSGQFTTELTLEGETA